MGALTSPAHLAPSRALDCVSCRPRRASHTRHVGLSLGAGLRTFLAAPVHGAPGRANGPHTAQVRRQAPVARPGETRPAAPRTQLAAPCTQLAAPRTQLAAPRTQLAAPRTQLAAPCTQPAAPRVTLLRCAQASEAKFLSYRNRSEAIFGSGGVLEVPSSCCHSLP